ncbi:MAG TPA: hypothetical protein VNN76_09615 [Bacteroidota bacterium]|nr:hypothetical protein [Bacteroidota bacterium]
MVLWIVGGCLLVSVVYFLAPQGTDPWPALNAAGIAALLYVIAFLVSFVKRPFSVRARVSIYAVSLVLGIAIYSAWTGMDEQSHWQRSQLAKINGVITHGIIASELHSTFLLPIFERYHKQESRRRVSLGALFRQTFPNARIGENIRPVKEYEDSTMIYVAELSDDTVTLVGQSLFVAGKNPGFRNYNGRVGRVQARATLTAKGVMYEQEN